MKKRSSLVVLLVLAMLLTGCQTEKLLPQSSPGAEIEPTAVYDWMAGESPVPNRRLGIVRVGVQNSVHAVSATGVYFVVNDYIMYTDYGSDKLIKLCGRPDCNHDNEDCNAQISGCTVLSYYKGYLYAILGDGSDQEAKLIRMDPDGSNQIEILNLLAFAKEHSGDFVRCELITEGVCFFHTKRWVTTNTANGGTTIKSELVDYYIYRLDGSMEEPVLQQSSGVMYNCGNTVLSYSLETRHGGEYGSYWSWDPVTEEQTYLTDHPGVPGYFDENAGYYFKDGAIRRMTYATQTEENLLDTGLEGKYLLLSFPDCLVLASRTDGETADKNLYFYNWNLELVDTVKITYPHPEMAESAIIAETADRLILQDHNHLPMYYINKSELGTGNVEIHQFKFS